MPRLPSLSACHTLSPPSCPQPGASRRPPFPWASSLLPWSRSRWRNVSHGISRRHLCDRRALPCPKKFDGVSCRHLSCAQCQILDMRDAPMLTTTGNASTSTVSASSATFCAQWDGLDDNYMPGECHATHSPCCFDWSCWCPAHVSPLHHREAHNYQNTLTLHTSNAVLTSSPCTANAECLQHNTIHTTVVETVVDWLR